MAKLTAEVKLNAVEPYLNGNVSQKTITDSIGVHESLLIIWIRLHEAYGGKVVSDWLLKSQNNQLAHTKIKNGYQQKSITIISAYDRSDFNSSKMPSISRTLKFDFFITNL